MQILRGGAFHAKLLDCGLAKALRGPDRVPGAGHSLTAGIVGTLGYMAPELSVRASYRRPADPRSRVTCLNNRWMQAY